MSSNKTLIHSMFI